jgi:hypothetical protein
MCVHVSLFEMLFGVCARFVLQGFEEHLQEVDASIGSTRKRDLKNRGAKKVSKSEADEQLRLFERVLRMLDGGGSKSSDDKKGVRGGDNNGDRQHDGSLEQRFGGCRAAAAVLLLETLLRANREFRYSHPLTDHTHESEVGVSV